VKIAVVHGPNLQLLGTREPEVYGRATLADIEAALQELASELDVELESYQSNSEGDILDFLGASTGRIDGFVVNAAALTHTSVALRDGLVATGSPFVEVHLSNTAAREAFRNESVLSSVARGVVFGFGVDSYLLGLRGLVSALHSEAGD
jgi:3-dehydroquinate dehydratase-2